MGSEHFFFFFYRNRIVYISVYDAPYLLVSTGNTLYARTVKTFDGHPVVRQVIATDSKITKMLGDKNGLIYATSATDVWRLTAVPFAKQIKRLLEEKHFPLAFRLAVSNVKYPITTVP